VSGLQAPAAISDSEFMVRQLQGRYRVRTAAIRPLYEQAHALTKQFHDFKIRHAGREHNERADALAKRAAQMSAEQGPATGAEVKPPPHFDWIVPRKLAAMRLPLPDDLERLRALGITLLVSLLADWPPSELVREAGLRHLRLPVENWCPPTEEQIREFVAEVRTELARGGQVAVHCVGGLGRTGILLAAYLVTEGVEPQAAIDLVRRRRPGAIETAAQEQAIFAWAQLGARRERN